MAWLAGSALSTCQLNYRGILFDQHVAKALMLLSSQAASGVPMFDVTVMVPLAPDGYSAGALSA